MIGVLVILNVLEFVDKIRKRKIKNGRMKELIEKDKFKITIFFWECDNSKKGIKSLKHQIIKHKITT